ncbi:hypothetical protein McpSp1_16580 [Methanocorpusculaceae archaeon Sp1]|nr:hypothetical protein [Methanocorpusculaceae archaeon Sp1]
MEVMFLKKILYMILMVFAVLLIAAVSPVAAAGENSGYIEVSCNVDGAWVELIDVNGNVADSAYCYGRLTFDVPVTGTPITQVRASKSGYYGDSSSVSMPSAGEYVSASLTLVSIPPTSVGGDVGYIQVSCNVDGAFVELLSASGSVLESGYCYGSTTFTVYTTGTPVTEVRASASGFYEQTTPVTMPGAGQTTYVSISLNMLPGPIPTESPMGFALFGLIGLIAVAAVLRRN